MSLHPVPGLRSVWFGYDRSTLAALRPLSVRWDSGGRTNTALVNDIERVEIKLRSLGYERVPAPREQRSSTSPDLADLLRSVPDDRRESLRRALLVAVHPDHGGTAEATRTVLNAFDGIKS